MGISLPWAIGSDLNSWPCSEHQVGLEATWGTVQPELFHDSVNAANVLAKCVWLLLRFWSLITDIFLIYILAQGYLFMVSEEKICTVNTKIN